MSSANPPPSYDGKGMPPYQPHQGASQSQQALGDGENRKCDFEGRAKYHDLWATLLFVAHTIAFFVLGVMGINHLATEAGNEDSGDTEDDVDLGSAFPPLTSRVRTIIFSVGAVFLVLSFLIGFGYLSLMRKAPKLLIKATFITGLAINLAMAIFLFAIGSPIFGVFMLLIVALFAYLYYRWQRYIPFTAALLTLCVEIGDKYPFSYAITFMSLIVALIYQVWWIASIAGILTQYGDESEGVVGLLIVFLLFSFYWTAEVLKNTLHVTIAGTVASWYFLEGTPAMPKKPALGAAKRAFTTSFGPICFGSLIIAILETIRALLRDAARDGSVIACIVEVILSCIESLIQYINRYAYIQVAMYGKSFCQAASDTWKLLVNSGFMSIISDIFIDNVITVGSLLVGAVIGVGCYGVLYLLLEGNELGTYAVYVGLMTFVFIIIGVVIIQIVGMFVKSSASTLYVCLAEQPGVLARTKPDIYERFKQEYPTIPWGI